MEELFKQYQNWLWGFGIMILGVGCFIFIRIQKKTDTEEYKNNMDFHQKSVDFGIYFMGWVGILGGLFILYKEIVKYILA